VSIFRATSCNITVRFSGFDFFCTARMYTLTNIVHRGNSIAIHNQFEMTRRRIRPQAKPEYAIHRGKIPVRNAITHVEKVKTPPS